MAEEVEKYIRNCLSKGYSAEKIKNTLLETGHDESLVSRKLDEVSGGMIREESPDSENFLERIRPENKKKLMKLVIAVILIILLAFLVVMEVIENRQAENRKQEYLQSLLENQSPQPAEAQEVHVSGTSQSEVYGCGEDLCIDVLNTARHELTLKFPEMPQYELSGSMVGAQVDADCTPINEDLCIIANPEMMVISGIESEFGDIEQ